MALSRGAGLKREGPSGTAPGKAWPLLFSASAHPLGAHSEDGSDGDAGTAWAQGLSEDFFRFRERRNEIAKKSRAVLGFRRLHDDLDH